MHKKTPLPETPKALRPATLLKRALAQVFFCEFCEISKNIFSTEHLWTTASETFMVIIIPVKESYFLDHVLLVITTLKLQSYNYLHLLPLIYANRKNFTHFYPKNTLPGKLFSVGLILLNFIC